MAEIHMMFKFFLGSKSIKRKKNCLKNQSNVERRTFHKTDFFKQMLHVILECTVICFSSFFNRR